MLPLRRVCRDFFGRRALDRNDLKPDFWPGLSADILGGCVGDCEGWRFEVGRNQVIADKDDKLRLAGRNGPASPNHI